VEKYLIEIARYYNVVYDPDPQVIELLNVFNLFEEYTEISAQVGSGALVKSV
jgi:hypothetical protein